jgi:hypothetical protein
MAAKKPRPSTRSSNPKTATSRGGNRSAGGTPRAQRNDTPEATMQRKRAPKTHPTRTPGAARKDKPTGAATPSAATPPPTPRVPPKKRRPSRALRRRNSPGR